MSKIKIINNVWDRFTSLRFQTKLGIAFSLLAIFISAVLTFASYLSFSVKARADLSQRFCDIVSIAALQIDADEHATLVDPAQEDGPVYMRIKRVLQNIRNAVPDVHFVYTCRKNSDGQIAFIVDAETDPEQISHLGDIYDSAEPSLLEKLVDIDHVMVDEKFVTDKWGVWLSGYAPFYRSNGRMEGILGMDIKASDVLAQERQFLWTALTVFLATVPLTLSLGLWFGRKLAAPIVKLTDGSECIAKGDLNYRVLVKGSYETNALAGAFNEMTNTLQKAIIYRDGEIDNRKKAEAALDAANRNLQATVRQLGLANRELADFAHTAAHDLKTPLRGIGVLAEWLADDYSDKFDDEGKKWMNLLVKRTQRMYDQITSLLSYAEMDVYTHRKNIDLNELVGRVVTDIKPPENIKITIADKLPVLLGRESCLVQIFQNLLTNAVKYIDKPQGKIVIGCVSEDGFWKFSVADNGIGIKEKYFNKIFEIFQTLDEDKDSGDTGMGLAVVKKIVEKLGGKVWVESTPGQGSVFFFTLIKTPEENMPIEQECQTTTVG